LLGGLVAAVLLAAGVAHGQTLLRYKFNRGDKVNFVMDQKVVMKMSVGGQDIAVTVNMRASMTQEVTSSPGNNAGGGGLSGIGQKAGQPGTGSADVVQRITHMRCEMTAGPGVNTTYDSDTNKNPNDQVGQQIAPLFNAIVGSEIKMKISPLGEISNTQLPQALTTAMQNFAAANPGGGGGMSPEQLKRMVEQCIRLPANAVNPGATWTQTLQNDMPPSGKLEFAYTYRYDGKLERKDGRKLEKITATAVGKVIPSPFAPAQVTIKAQSLKGTILFDNQMGQIFQTDVVQDMQIEVSAQGQTIPMTLQQTISLRQVPPKSR
jgi:hypothetical protein